MVTCKFTTSRASRCYVVSLLMFSFLPFGSLHLSYTVRCPPVRPFKSITVCSLPLGAIITIFDIYASALSSIDVNSRGGRLMRFHQILQHCWFKGMTELQKVRLQSWMEPYCVLEQWRNIGPKLGIQHTRFSQPPSDPDDVDTGDRLCHWSGCLCHKNVPYHPLRVCRGCWRVFYCSTLCQTRSVFNFMTIYNSTFDMVRAGIGRRAATDSSVLVDVRDTPRLAKAKTRGAVDV